MTTETKGKQTLSDKLGWGGVFAYSVGDWGMSIFWVTFGSFITYFMTNYIGLAAGLVGTAIIVTRVLDSISDVVMGTIVDRTKSRFGKARPWIIRLTLPLMASFILTFCVPNGLSQTGKFVWFIIFYNLTATVFYTGVNTSYQAMNPLVTRDPESRTRINTVRNIGGSIGGMVAGSQTIPMIMRLGNDQAAWITWVSIVAGIMLVFLTIVVIFSRERYRALPNQKSTTGLFNSFKILFSNKYWVMLTVALVANQMCSGAVSGGQIYYFQYTLGNVSAFSYAAYCAFVPGIIVYLITPTLLKKFPRGGMAKAGAIGMLVAPVWLLLAPTTVWAALVRPVLQGACMGPFMAVYFSSASDIADYNYWKTGIRSEGIILSGASFGLKVGTGLGAAMVGWLLGIGGFDAKLAVQPESAFVAINFLMIWIPIICGVVGTIALFRYDLDKYLPQVRAELAEREKAEAAAAAKLEEDNSRA